MGCPHDSSLKIRSNGSAIRAVMEGELTAGNTGAALLIAFAARLQQDSTVRQIELDLSAVEEIDRQALPAFEALSRAVQATASTISIIAATGAARFLADAGYAHLIKNSDG